MEKSRNNIDDMTLNVSVKNGIKYAKDNFRAAVRMLMPVSLVIAVVSAVAWGGNIGIVKTNYITYMPFHEVSMPFFLRYAAGLLIVLVAFMLWKGISFAVLQGDSDLKTKDKILAGLKYIQFCLLAFLVFGIVGAALIVASLKLSVWLWIAVGLYMIFITVPLFVAEYEYMIPDSNFRTSLRKGFKVLKEQWGRVFFRLLIVNAVAVLLFTVVLLPAASLMLGIYDNATAVSMENAPATPVFIYIMEFLFLVLGMIASLCVVFFAMSGKKAFFEECNATAYLLAEEKAGKFAD